ncbi:hypothetical protein DIS24_g5118 [Lasiodiplodia hormozganensis]|uniref:Uncharacterized protein n=1 Tax=Lasiodiplodia hormozganensis TaxID=869390 RepID=A0AA40CXX7_9PEZI|nr:hypothetical protein DIS24_g5118 [Lasiodiplodia hormozganensis]
MADNEYIVSPMTETPYVYDDDTYIEKYKNTNVEVVQEADIVDETSFIHENMKLNTPHPPLSLFKKDPLEYIMEFMFLPRPQRLRECDWEFWCLHWQPVTFHMLEICTEYCSQKNVDLMNENAELERELKRLGPRRTAVLTTEVYEAQTIERTRNPPKEGEQPWNREDHIWCICEGTKMFPKNLAKNQRFKERLGLPVPGEDYEVIRGVVRNELETLQNMPDRPIAPPAEVKKKKTKPAPASKVGGVRRKAAKKPNKRNAPEVDEEEGDEIPAATYRSPFVVKATPATATATAPAAATASAGHKRNTSKRTVQENPSDEEYVPSPKRKPKSTNNKKKGQQKPAAADADADTPTTTPVRGRKKSGFQATAAAESKMSAASESKLPKGSGITVKGEDNVIRRLGSPIHFKDPATFAPYSDDDWFMASDTDVSLSWLFEDEIREELEAYDSDDSQKTVTPYNYCSPANNCNRDGEC